MTFFGLVTFRPRALGTAAALASLAACSLSAPYSGVPTGGNGFGATQGGAQDMGLARELIAAGTVPPPEAFVVEGMFSEHDLPVAGDSCARTLCVRGAGAVAPDLGGTRAGWVQLGLSSSIDPATFERPAGTLIATVDVSGSMGWGGGPDTPGELSRSLLHAMIDQLGADDQLAIVTYGSSVATPVETAPVDASHLHTVIDGLATNGSTDIEAGLHRAIDLAGEARALDATRPVRILLFTDEQPNVGATSPEAFGGMVATAAEDDIGITVLGAGNGLGQDILLAMSHLPGGNAFSIFDPEDVPALMEDSWPWMIVPLAFDLHVEVTLGAGLRVERAFGFPSADPAAGLALDASTVFLSRRRGAFLVQLAGLDAASLAGAPVSLALSYEEPDGERVNETLDVTLPATEASEAYPQAITRSAVTLALLVTGMHDAANAYGIDRTAAIGTMQRARDRIAADAMASADASLADEVELADDLLALMIAGAPQR